MDLINEINSMDNKTAIEIAYSVADSMGFETKLNEKEAVAILSNTYPNLSKSIEEVESEDEKKKGILAKNFLTALVNISYSSNVEAAISNPTRVDPLTLMVVAAAIVFVLQTKFNASYEKLPDGKTKLKIDVGKEPTSESLIEKIFKFGANA